MTNFVPYEKLSKEIKRRCRKEKNLILRLLAYVFIIK